MANTAPVCDSSSSAHEGEGLIASPLQKMMSDQAHPDAVKNIRSTLEPKRCPSCLCDCITSLPQTLLFLFVFLTGVPLAITLAVPLALFYCLCRSCALRVCGLEEQNNHQPSWMIVPHSEQNLPNKLRGILYMRGNPFPDALVTFDRSRWDAGNRVLLLNVSAARVMTFHLSAKEFVVLVLAKLFCYRYEMRFSEDLCDCSILMKLWCATLPPCLAAYNMTDVSREKDGSLWERWNVACGRPVFSYWAEKVVDAGGNRTEYFAHVLAEAPEKCFTGAGP